MVITVGFNIGSTILKNVWKRRAAVNHRRLFYLQRDGLDKSAEHEYRKAAAKPQVQEYDSHRIIQIQHVGDLCHRKHHHLEGHDHREDEQIIERRGKAILNPHDIPGGHRSTQDDEGYRKHRDE